jgi:hypothetical protein
VADSDVTSAVSASPVVSGGSAEALPPTNDSSEPLPMSAVHADSTAPAKETVLPSSAADTRLPLSNTAPSPVDDTAGTAPGNDLQW